MTCVAYGSQLEGELYITGRIQSAGHVLFLNDHHQLRVVQLAVSTVQTFKLLQGWRWYERC